MSLGGGKFLISCTWPLPFPLLLAIWQTNFKCSCVNLASTGTHTYANGVHTGTHTGICAGRQSLQLSNKQGPAQLLCSRQEAGILTGRQAKAIHQNCTFLQEKLLLLLLLLLLLPHPFDPASSAAD